MRNILQDQRSDQVLNYADNPTGQAPVGFLPAFLGPGVPDLTVREFVQVTGAPVPVYTGVKHTRVTPTAPTTTFGTIDLVGIYGEPMSGPWLLDVPFKANDVTMSAYVYASRAMQARWSVNYGLATPAPYTVTQGVPVAVPANTWTRISWTTTNGRAEAPSMDVNSKAFSTSLSFTTTGNVAAGDSVIMTAVQVEEGVAVSPYFDGNAVDAWWNVIRIKGEDGRSGAIRRGAGLVNSSRPTLRTPPIQARRSNRVGNPRGSLTGFPLWSFAGSTVGAAQIITGLNTVTGVSTAQRRTLTAFTPTSTVAIVANGTPVSDGMAVTPGDTFSAGVLFWHSDPGVAYAYVNFYTAAGASAGTAAGAQVPVTPGTAGSAATWLTVKGTVPATAAYGRVSAGWPPNSHPDAKVTGQIFRTNLVTNPRVIGRSFTMAGATGTQTDVATGGPLGFGYRRVVLATTTTSSPISLQPTNTGSAAAPVIPGRTYTFSAYARMVGGAEPATSGGIAVNWYDAAGASLSSDNTYQGVLANNVWTRHVKTLVAPAGAAYALIIERFSATAGLPPVGSEYGATGFLMEEAPAVGDYFDGSTANTASWTTAWVGTVNDSPSNMISTGDYLQASSMYYESNRTTDVLASEYFDGNTVEAGNEAYSWTGVAERSISNAVDTSNIAITNLCVNPSFEVDVVGWSTGNGFTSVIRTASFPQMAGKVGDQISSCTTTVADRYGTLIGPTIPAKAGKWYGAVAWAACDGAAGRLIRIGLVMTGPSIAATYPFTDRASTDAAWYTGARWSVAAVAPTGVTEIRPRMQMDAGVGNTLPIGTRMWTDQWLVVEGENSLDVNEKMRRYLDGSMPDDPDLVYWWTGTAHASVSRRALYPKP